MSPANAVAVQSFCVESLQQSRLFDQFIKLSPGPDQLGRCIKFDHSTLVEYGNLRAVYDCSYPVRHGDDGAILEDGAPQRLLEHDVCLNIHGRL